MSELVFNASTAEGNSNEFGLSRWTSSARQPQFMIIITGGTGAEVYNLEVKGNSTPMTQAKNSDDSDVVFNGNGAWLVDAPGIRGRLVRSGATGAAVTVEVI